MKKIYKLLERVNNLRVIDLLLDHPDTFVTTDEVDKKLRKFTGYSNTCDSLSELSKAKLLRKKPKKKKKEENKYKISSRSEAFRDIFNGYRLYDSERVERLLKSDYTNFMIKKRGFKKIHEVIKQEFHDPKFRQVASVLLNQSAVHEEYKQFAEGLHATISQVKVKEDDDNFLKNRKHHELYAIGKELGPNKIDEIDLLKDFEPIAAVRFYRVHIHKSVIAGLGELRDSHIISEGLHDFLVLDNYLSPLSSYPVNGTLQLLFAQPFQRIYEDIYLLDGEAFGVLSSRAAAIFNNFADIIFELIKNDPPERKTLCTVTKQMIFHWNIASTRFDLICHQLEQLYEKEKNRNYHLCTEGLNYKIEDLNADSKQVLQEHISKSILVEGSVPLEFDEFGPTRFIARSIENPFTRLRPCLTFKDMNWRNDFIPIKEILGELELKLTPNLKRENLADSLDS